MIAFDSDILSELLHRVPEFVERADAISAEEQSLPIVTVEEVLRGRLSAVRRAEAGRGRISLERAYRHLQDVIEDVQEFHILPYTSTAEALFQEWRSQKIRIGTHDLRIAAIAAAHSATLITRNHRDFDLVPNLDVEYWG